MVLRDVAQMTCIYTKWQVVGFGILEIPPDVIWWEKVDVYYGRVGGNTPDGLHFGYFALALNYGSFWGQHWAIGDPDGFWYGGTKKYARVGGCDNLGYLQDGYSFLDLINNPGGYGWDYGAPDVFWWMNNAKYYAGVGGFCTDTFLRCGYNALALGDGSMSWYWAAANGAGHQMDSGGHQQDLMDILELMGRQGKDLNQALCSSIVEHRQRI